MHARFRRAWLEWFRVDGTVSKRGWPFAIGIVAVAALLAACRINFDPITDAATDGNVGDGVLGGDGQMACRTETQTCDQVTLICCADLICIDLGGTFRCD